MHPIRVTDDCPRRLHLGSGGGREKEPAPIAGERFRYYKRQHEVRARLD